MFDEPLDELVVDCFFTIGVCAALIGEQQGNPDYTSKELYEDIPYGTDIYKKDFDKNVYKELKSLKRKKVISNDEYEKLVLHQKNIDARIKKFKEIEIALSKNDENTKIFLEDVLEQLKISHSEGKIDFEKYSDYKARIEGRILAIETSKYR